VLLLHGLTGTPHEVRPIAMALHSVGYAVRAPLLPGHTDLGALEQSTWRDWYAAAWRELESFRDDGRRRVVVLGFSMGALLCLRLAALRAADVEGAVAIAVPLELAAWKRRAIHALARMRTTPMLRDLVGVFSKTRGADVRIQRHIEASPSLPGFPYPTLAELVGLQTEVVDLLPHVRVPLLLLHGAFDHTAPPQDSERVAQRVSSARVERRILPRSFHVVGLDLDVERACSEVVTFVQSVLPAPSPHGAAPS
jgi:carboxylesterase